MTEEVIDPVFARFSHARTHAHNMHSCDKYPNLNSIGLETILASSQD